MKKFKPFTVFTTKEVNTSEGIRIITLAGVVNELEKPSEEFPDYFGLGIGMSLSSPFDIYNKEIGEKISEGRARNQHKSIYSTFTMNKSLFTKPTVEAILKVKIDFIADNLHLFTKSKHVILK